MSWSLRLAHHADLPVIVDIYNSTVASREVTADTEPVSMASREDWFAAHQKATRPLWVVQDEQGAVAGWMSFSSFYGRPAYDGTIEVSIYLAEAARGKGLGSWLLQQAMVISPSLGVKTILGFIFGHNQPSLGLFRKFGFTEWANLPRIAVLDDVERDLIILGLRLPESA
ncbi:N-acetyltransferase family protein [Silvimonas sp.]|uniref:GNAT family N-acetyltransferase n=1 Tax=Silvimonas sp. TaxID=2650811 RepID=UPI002841BCFF|nr:N-acetyltransferase family protein [Silvimonas sp.]MDR3430127.1 GNAT family N-acetyltransferase [Silvimonas sp.]